MREVLITLHKGEVILVKGPAHAKLFSGQVFCLGRNFNELIIREGKALPIETEESASIRLFLYGNASYEIHKGGMGTSIWLEDIKGILNELGKEIKKIVIVGPTDSGKSTLTVLLTNLAVNRGLKVGILDGDIGQADLTPPAFAGCKVLSEGIFDLRDVLPDDAVAVGFIDVSFDESFVIDCLKRALNKLKNVDLIIVNTDGYIERGGLLYKKKLIEEINPDLVFLISDEALSMNFRDLKYRMIILRLPSAVAKDRSTRILRREMQYNRFILTTNKLILDLKKVKLGFLGRIFEGYELEGKVMIKRSLDDYKLKITSQYGDMIVVNEFLKVISMAPSILEGMIVGLEKDSKINKFGMIEKIYDEKIRLMSDAKLDIDVIWLTTLRLRNGEEQKIRMFKISA